MTLRPSFIARLLFVAGLLTWLIYRLDLSRFSEHMDAVQFIYFIPVFMLIGLESALRSYNWTLLLRCKGGHVRYCSVLYAYLAGAFFGTLIPSSMGVDLTRFLILSRSHHVRTQDAAVTVVALNVLSLLVLCLTVAACALFLSSRVEYSTFLLLLSAGSSTAVICFALVYYFHDSLRKVISARLQGGFMDKLWMLIEAFSVFQHYYLLLGKIGVITLINIFLTALTVYYISVAVSGDIPLIYFLLLMPIINLTRLIPHSIAGLGGEQGIFIFLFSSFGFRAETIFLISLLLSASVVLFMLSGGMLYLARHLFASDQVAT